MNVVAYLSQPALCSLHGEQWYPLGDLPTAQIPTGTGVALALRCATVTI